jgi:G3E family GTPase
MKKDVYVLSGFLGSGKTTLLKKILKSFKDQGKKPAVLMNELGSVSIDSDVVEEDTPLKELLDGCICCTIQEKLESQLQELLWNEEFDVLIIETTGAAHPVEVVDSILSPLFADRLQFKGILTVVDAFQWKARSELSPAVLHLMREQIRHANYIIVNKEDLLTEMEKGTVVFEIQQLNSNGKLYLTNYSNIPLQDIVTSNVKMGRLQHQKADIGKELALQAIVYTFEGVVTGEVFENWLRDLPSSIYRIKGYIPLKGRKYPTMFQYSYGMPLFMPEQMNMPKNLVIIGEGITKQDLLHSLEQIDEK